MHLIFVHDTSDREIVVVVDGWKHANFLCRTYIFNELDNTLYNLYSPIKIANEPWESLDKKYKREDAKQRNLLLVDFLITK